MTAYRWFLLLGTILAVGGAAACSRGGSGSSSDPSPPDSSPSDDFWVLDDEIDDSGEKLIRVPTPRFPLLHANIFSPLREDVSMEDQARRLSHFGLITKANSFLEDYPDRRGYGCRSQKEYELGVENPPSIRWRKVIARAKRDHNPDMKVFVHGSLQYLHLPALRYGDNHPMRWFADAVSPKWFAYNRLIELQEDQKGDQDPLVFRFAPEDLRNWVREQGVNRTGPAPYWHPSLQYEFQYLSFFDNDCGAGRGCFEIMAIAKVDVEAGTVTVAPRKAGPDFFRNVYGRSHQYSAGHRAGILSHSGESWGAPVVIMNFLKDCPRVDGSTWTEALVNFLDDFILSAMKTEPVVDGILMDADSEDALWSGFTMLRQNNYHPDFNLDGKEDRRCDLVHQSIGAYRRYEADLQDRAAGKEVSHRFLLLKNGAFEADPITGGGPWPRWDINGRTFEDFNGKFQGLYKSELEQYREMFEPGNLRDPVYVGVRERNREYDERGGIDFLSHRNVMAMTLVFGDGYYGHTGSHALRHPELLGNGEPVHDFLDEFSVDPEGRGCNHPDYSGSYREEYSGWLGKETVPVREVKSLSENSAWIREFENGIAVFTVTGGVFPLGGTYKKILGAPGSQGDPFNDGSTLESIPIGPYDGAVLIRNP